MPSGWHCCQPTGFSGSSQVPTSPPEEPRRTNLDHCLHRLVGLFDRSRGEQHHGLWSMTSRSGFVGSHSHTGRPSRSFTWSRSKQISPFSRFIPRLVSSFWARTMRRMSPIPRWDFLSLRCTGTAGRPPPRSEHSCSALLPHCCLSDGHNGSGRDGCGLSRWPLCLRAFT